MMTSDAFTYLLLIAFASAEDEKAFGESDWAKEHFKKAQEKSAGPPIIRKFQTGDFPASKPKALTQFSFLELADESKHEEAKQAWLDLVAALGQESFGGRSADDDPLTGLGVIGWDSKEVLFPAISFTIYGLMLNVPLASSRGIFETRGLGCSGKVQEPWKGNQHCGKA